MAAAAAASAVAAPATAAAAAAAADARHLSISSSSNHRSISISFSRTGTTTWSATRTTGTAAMASAVPPPAPAPAADPRYAGRVLGPADPAGGWWDATHFSGAVVVERPPAGGGAAGSEGGGFAMYYYGRSGPMWHQGVEAFNQALPTGRIGMAVSPDGRGFRRVRGPLRPGGAVLDPADDPAAFDSVHIGVSEVVVGGARGGGDGPQEEKGSAGASAGRDVEWLMYYFGGGRDEVPLVGTTRTARGARLRPGLATSRDGGLTWSRSGTPLLPLGAPGEWDRNGVSWPRVLPPASTGGDWLMTYHTREDGGPRGTGFFAAGLATSPDGRTWLKRGKVLGPGAPGTWDEGGVSVRHVLRLPGSDNEGAAGCAAGTTTGTGTGSRPRYLMLYEGSDFAFRFAVGVAVSEDGVSWAKDERAGPEPGGPVLRAREGRDVWDNVLVGTPYVVARPGGALWMYYLGVGKVAGEEATRQGIGLAVSHVDDFRSWKRFDE